MPIWHKKPTFCKMHTLQELSASVANIVLLQVVTRFLIDYKEGFG